MSIKHRVFYILINFNKPNRQNHLLWLKPNIDNYKLVVSTRVNYNVN